MTAAPIETMDRQARQAMLRRVDDLAGRFLDLVVGGDPSTPVAATPGWTVRDVTAHMVTVVARYAQGPRGEGAWVDEPADLPALNARLLEAVGEESLPGLVGGVRSELRTLLDQMHDHGDEIPSFRFNGGQVIRADDALGLLVGELLVHGHDVAEARGRAWRITAADVELVLRGMEAVLPGFVDPDRTAGHTATYDVRVRGGGAHRWRFVNGRLDVDVDATRGAVDCHVSGEAAALLLVMYGRIRPWRGALTGKVVAWGRRPWLALSLPGRFHDP